MLYTNGAAPPEDVTTIFPVPQILIESVSVIVGPGTFGINTDEVLIQLLESFTVRVTVPATKPVNKILVGSLLHLANIDTASFLKLL